MGALLPGATWDAAGWPACVAMVVVMLTLIVLIAGLAYRRMEAYSFVSRNGDEMPAATESQLDFLKSIDSPTVCNLIEVVAPERRGFGYTVKHLHCPFPELAPIVDRKSTRLNSSHLGISYAVFCLKKKKTHSVKQAKDPPHQDQPVHQQNTAQ